MDNMITLLLHCLLLLLSISSIARIEGFSSSKIPSTYHGSSSKNSPRLKGTAAISISQFRHDRIHRPLFGTAINSDIQKKAQATAKKNSTNKSKYRKKYKHKHKKKSSTNNKYQKHNKYRRKQKQRSKSSTNNINRQYDGPTKDELKALTEYHLSQNINTNDCHTIPQEECLSNDEDMSCSICSYGDMSTQQMDEFSRLISSWYKLQSSGTNEMKSRQDKLLAAEMSEQCLRELIEERIVGKNILANNNRITTDLYYNVIKSWLNVADNGKFGKSKSYYYKDLLHATSLLDLMERTHDMNSEDDESSRDDKFISSSIKCYATILDGWCKSKSPGSEAKAEEILQRMTSVGGGAVDVRYYNNVMNRIATSGKNNAGAEAERILNQLIDLYKKDPGEAASVPNRNSFNTVIKAYANSGDKDSSMNVQRILNMMEELESLGLPDSIAKQIMPDKISYTSILNAWAHNGSSDENVGERAEELLQQMYDMYNSSDGSDRRKDVKPDTVTYNAVLKVWGKCGHPDSGERSIALLDDMIQRYKDGDSSVLPDDVTYNSVINNIANSKSEDAPRRAIQLLEEMESSYESGLIKSKPDIISYNSVLNAFAKQGGYTSAKRAEEILNKLEESYDSRATNIQPDVISYNIVISAWGGDANKAVALLDRMRYRTNEGKAQLKPDITTYNSILNAWSQSPDRNAPVKALGLLEIMLRLHEGGDTSAKPDVQSFTTVINAFSKSKFPRKARQTRDLLKRMKSLNDKGQLKMRTNVFVYAAVLNACAYTFGRSEEKEEALQVAIEMYDELQASTEIETNHVAYGSFIRVCRRLIPDESERDKYITRVFRQCCDDGQLGYYVLRQLRAVPSLYKSLLQGYIDEYGDEVVYQELPKRWTCNVKEGRGRR